MTESGQGGTGDPNERPGSQEPDDDYPTEDLPSAEEVGPPDSEPSATHGFRHGVRVFPPDRGGERSPRHGHLGATHLRWGKGQAGRRVRRHPEHGQPEHGQPRRGDRAYREPNDRRGPPQRGPGARTREELAVDSVGVAADVPAGVRPPGRRYLLDTERRVIFVRRHPALLLRNVLETLGALILAGVLTAQLPNNFVLVDVIWYGVLFVIARLLYHLAEWSVDRLVVTDRRMMLITGLFTRKVAMMPLVKVTDMTYERSVMGRILGYGEFIMESAGQDQALHRVHYVPAPDRLYRQVSELLFGDQGGGSEPGSGRSGGSDD